MATTITAGNATNGAAISSDSTGILELKSGTGSGTTAMTVNASQNVGIGTTSPSVSGLEISRATGVSPTPVELRLTTTTNDSGWSTTNPWGRLSFYSADASVGGAKVHASIQTTAQSSSGGNSNLDFFVTDTANGTLFRTLSFQGAGTNTTQTLFYSGGGTNTMTLDASGNLLLGSTTGRSTDALGLSQFQIESAGFSSFQMFSNGNNTDGSYINLCKARGGVVGGTTTVQANDILGGFFFGGYNGSSFRSGAAIYGRAVGTISASAMPGQLEFLTTPSGSNIPTERVRITSGGYFKASNSGAYQDSNGAYHELYQTTASDPIAVFRANNTGYAYGSPGAVHVVVNRNTSNNSYYYFGCYNTALGATKFTIADSGNATNTNGSYGAISDAKMKTDIVDAGSQWNDIKAIRFRKFKMIGDPEQIVQLGVVAQEIEQVSPGLVEEHKDTDVDGNDLGTTTKSVKTSILYMKATVALQEAMTRIELLEAEVAALKGESN